MLAADADLDVRLLGPGLLDGDIHQLANAELVERFERVRNQDVVLDIERQELVLGVFTREREAGLGQVVGTEREELGDIGQIVGPAGRRGRLRASNRT